MINRIKTRLKNFKLSAKLRSKTARRWLVVAGVLVGLMIAWIVISSRLAAELQTAYLAQSSPVWYDRSGRLLDIKPNSQGDFDQFLTAAPKRFGDLLLKKEDRFFYWHPGINPLSLVRDFFTWVATGKRGGSSTLTQQLVKILLGNTNDRSLTNKLREFLYTESLELHASKQQILLMYLNSAYFGPSSQGIKDASLYYFGVPPENLNDAQILSLLATLNSTSLAQPTYSPNLARAKLLAKHFKLNIPDETWKNISLAKTGNYRQNPESFELGSLNVPCQNSCQLTLDSDLTKNIRDILRRNLQSVSLQTASNGAVVVIKLPENQILSLVGSPDPSSADLGQQLNMAIKPRPIGSTAKPFIYLKAFEQGARPYSLVDDTEMKYQLGTGFDFFPQNFDGQFRGLVTLHQALDNSLNIPSVQVLSFVGLDKFYNFLSQDLLFKPQQPLENYELSIALGGLEVDPLTLSYYFSLFPQQGWLKPLTIYKNGYSSLPYYQPPMAQPLDEPKKIGQEAEVELVNKILNDRKTGVDQFGIKSNLNLPFANYAVKTGTSRDYHDSWTVGYTPDFLVAVWIGNSDNRAMKQITGLAGAAKVWHEVMNLMYNTDYNKNTPFNFDKIQYIQSGDTLDFALAGDDYSSAREIMLHPQLMLNPHEGDQFLLQSGASITLSASAEVDWSVNGQFFAHAQKTFYPISKTGSLTIKAASSDGKTQQVTVTVNKE